MLNTVSYELVVIHLSFVYKSGPCGNPGYCIEDGWKYFKAGFA